MIRAIEIVPTVVPHSLDDISRVRNHYAHFSSTLHLDATDGVFAPHRTWFPNPDQKFPNLDTTTYEAHLMVSDPKSAGIAFARAGGNDFNRSR